MLLILFSWLYIFIVALSVGVAIKQLLNLNYLNPIIILLFGLFGVTLFTGFWAVFSSVNGIYQVIQLLITCLLFFYNKQPIFETINIIKQQFKGLSIALKISFIIVLVLALAQCASPPFVIDNESYYIQTIKWLNEYGFVKGLVNLHLFLGQTSGWHILQSAFNFSFIYSSLNDISGFCLLIGNFYAITSLNQYLKATQKNRIDLAIGLFPIFNVFFFQFISAPSADIAIYVIALIVFHQFLICFSNYSKTTFITITILSLFASLIKLTGLFLILFVIILCVQKFSEVKKTIRLITSLGIITLSLFVIKNIIITGTLFYPLHGLINTDWSLPNPIIDYISNYSKATTYNLSIEDYNKASILGLFKKWLFLPKLHGFINKLMIVLLVVFPFTILKSIHRKTFLLIYTVSLINLVSVFFISPQYRFFFPFLMILILISIAQLIRGNKLIYISLVGTTILTCVPLLYPINNSSLTNTTYHTISSTFSFNYSILPYNNSRYNTKHETVSVGNLKLNAPTEIDFFWGTGDIPLPALKEEQLDYFSTYFNTIPQLRGKSIEDGFYSKNLLND